MRSLLFVPGHNERLMESAKRSDADVIILDLEDSVPDKDRDKARELVREFVCDKPVYVRIKSAFDLAYVNDSHTIMVPKSHTNRLRYYDNLGYNKLIALIETAQGVLEAAEICKLPNVVAVAFGGEDFKADLQGTDTHTARSIIAMAARAAGITPIDSVHTKVNDLDDLEKSLRVSKSLGYGGMLCLHPKEIPLVHKWFTPSKEEIERAEKIVKYEGQGVVVVDGEIIGPPMIRAAKKLL